MRRRLTNDTFAHWASGRKGQEVRDFINREFATEVDVSNKSIYITEPELHSYGGSVQLILDEINASANSPEWKELDFKARQYSLF